MVFLRERGCLFLAVRSTLADGKPQGGLCLAQCIQCGCMYLIILNVADARRVNLHRRIIGGSPISRPVSE